MGAAILRIHGLGAEPAGRESGAGLVDPARLVYESELLARSRTSLQPASRVCDSRPHCGGGAKRSRVDGAGGSHELAVRTIRTALAAATHAPADRERRADLHGAQRIAGAATGGGRAGKATNPPPR